MGLGERHVSKRIYHVEQGVVTGRKIRGEKTLSCGIGCCDWEKDT